MALHIISTNQIVSSVVTVAIALVSCVWLVHTFLAYLDLPEVYQNGDGNCVKVVNYRNGDGYTCSDKDVVLRKYTLVRVQ